MTEKIIYKFGPLNFSETPVKGRIVHVGLQNGDVFVWTEQEVETPQNFYPLRHLRLHSTGQPYTGEYHGTVVMPSGFVWHVIEGE
jgi:hypothetical protein